MALAPRPYPTSKTVTRFVVTHRDKDGLIALATPAQGRFTYATREEAQSHVDDLHANNSPERLSEFFGLPLVVRECECYAGHFDPVRIYFDN